mgnify:CR=1 FL=1
MKNIKDKEILERINGVQTLKSIKKILNVNEKRAVYLVSRLRKKGYVKTIQEKDNTRVYNISKKNAIEGKSYFDVINKYAPLGIYPLKDYKIHGKTPSLEETLIYAIKTQEIRTLIACLGLFKKIHNWNLLYRLAKKDNLLREVGALYDIARLIIKTRKISKRFINLSLPGKNDKYKYLKEGFKSANFNNIEQKWKVYIPLNMADLEEYLIK